MSFEKKPQKIYESSLFGEQLSSKLAKKKQLKHPTTEPQKAAKNQYDEFFQQANEVVEDFNAESIGGQTLKHHRIRILKKEDITSVNLIREGSEYIKVKFTGKHGIDSTYDVLIGQFKMTIVVLNLQKNSSKSSNYVGSGSFGIVQSFETNGLKGAIKKIMFPPPQPTQIWPDCYHIHRQWIQSAIRQYSMYKICSMLGIGPKILFHQTYDLVCYHDCIEFQMELCVSSRECKVKSFEHDLKVRLRKLHMLKFIHKDIKKQNVVYSPSQNCYLFVDYGLAHSLKEEVWQRTYTKPQGTLFYANSEMHTLLTGKTKGKVNLYLNDVHALQKTLTQLSQSTQQFLIYGGISYKDSESYGNSYGEDYDESEEIHDQGNDRNIQIDNKIVDVLYHLLQKQVEQNSEQNLQKQVKILSGDEEVERGVRETLLLDSRDKELRVEFQNCMRIYGLYSQQMITILNNLRKQAIKDINLRTLLDWIPIVERAVSFQDQELIRHRIHQNHTSLISTLITMLRNPKELRPLLELYLEVHDKILASDLHFKMANILHVEQNPQEFYQTTILQAIHTKMKQQQWLDLKNLTNILRGYISVKNALKSESILHEGKKLIEQETDIFILIEWHLSCAYFFPKIQQYQNAHNELLSLHKILTSEKSLHQTSLMFICLDKLTLNLIRLQKFAQALSKNQQSLALKQRILYPADHGWEFSNYYFLEGVIRAHEGKYLEASQFFEEAIRRLPKWQHEEEFLVEVLQNLALAKDMLKLRDEAFDLLNRAYTISLLFRSTKIQIPIRVLSKLVSFILHYPEIYPTPLPLHLKQLASFKHQILRSKRLRGYSDVEKYYLIHSHIISKQHPSYLALKKIIISAIEPFLPLFQHQYFSLCEELANYYFNVGHQPTLGLFYAANHLGRIQKVAQTESQYDTFIKFGSLLDKYHSFSSAVKFMESFIFFLPSHFKKARMKSYRELSTMSEKKLGGKYLNSEFYFLVFKHKAYYDSQCYEEAWKQIQKTNCKAKRKLLQKKLKIIYNSSFSQIQQSYNISQEKFQTITKND